MSQHAVPAASVFLNDASETGRLIAQYDWSATALGPMSEWSASLAAVVGLIGHSPVPMALMWGRDGYLLYNDAYAALAGPRHPQVLGRKVREAWPEVADLNDHAIQVGLAGGTLAYRNQELLIHRHVEPEQMWLNLDYSPVLKEDGQPGGVMVVVVDRTENVLAERRLAAERERLRRMFEQAPGFMAMLEGPDHVFVLTNRAYMELLGGRELVGRTVREAVPEAAPQGFVRLLDDAYRTGKPFVGTGLKLALADAGGLLEDHYIDFVYQPILDAAGKVTGIFVAGSDVTERTLAETALHEGEDRYRRLNDALILVNDTLEQQVGLRTAELRAKEARLRAIFESSFSFQGLLSLDGKLLDTNAASLAAVDVSLDAVRGLAFWETPWFTGTPGAGEMIRETVPRVAAGEEVRREAVLELPVGGVRRFDLMMRPIRDPDGRVGAIALEALETTERPRAYATR